jgi:hypothetical protein
MDMREQVDRTAERAGTSRDLTARVIEAHLAEASDAIRRGETVSLGALGTLRGTTFTPGPALGGLGRTPLSDTEGYDEGTAPRDS